MKKRVSTFSALPKWFDKKNYLSAYKLSKEQWFYELWLRRFYYQTPVTGIFHEQGRESYFGSRRFLKHVSQDAEKSIKNYSDCSVLECEELVFTGLLTSGKYFKSLKLRRPDFLMPLKQLSREDIIKGRVRHDRAVLEINLQSPDSVLNREFENWLKVKREENLSSVAYRDLVESDGRRKGEITNIDLEKELLARANSGLLPYLDLHQWACLKNVKIKQKDFAGAVLSLSLIHI